MRILPVAILLGLLLPAMGHAQTTAPSAAERMLNEMLQPGPSSAAAPTTRPQPGPILQPAGYSPKPSTSGLLREGSDIIARRGHLRKSSNDLYSQFIFDKSQGLAPMYVLPNLQLMSMEDASAATKEDLNFTISGMVTEYRGKNYILLEAGPEALDRQISPPVSPVAASSSGKTTTADQMLKQMLSAEQPSNTPPAETAGPAQDSTSGSGALPPNAPSLTVLPEQSQIFDRVCRLGPTADGLHEQITFDADGDSLHDPPMVVLPNLKLVDLEKAAGDHTVRLRVTGTVTEYRGRNYILLQKVVVMADSDRQL
jgi:hypothetical protein